MSTELEALARRAVACKHWRWMPGMLVMSDPTAVPRVIGSPIWPSDLRARVTSAVLGRWFGVGEFCVDHPDAEHETMSGDDLPDTLPDLSDPATMGCLLALVREAWGSPSAYAMPWGISPQRQTPEGWSMMVRPDDTLPTAKLSAPTEAAALVAALEAAP